MPFRGAVLVSITTLVLMLWMVPTSLAQAGLMPESCADRVVHDYSAPLKAMPANRLPPSDKTSFAPSGVELEPINRRKVLVPGSRIGYLLNVERAAGTTGRLKRPLSLHWNVQTTLHKVDAQGGLRRLVIRKRKYVRKVFQPGPIEFTMKAPVGLYRLGLLIKEKDGTPLGRFYEYNRVLPLHVRLRLAANGKKFVRGETAVGRIENVGTSLATLVSLEVERYTDPEGWVSVDPLEITSVGGEEFLRMGRATRCSKFEIPLDAARGLYRFKAIVEAYSHRAQRVLLSRNFFVS